eukprot:CAMPEP_0202713444 /NCGR_PEP_ID=MMETSP1385-20130828/54031_1 /ASSEMBLY_ACC=CAM_ASM_000861 /TAXON_ID=933848 /ORGANISM="Elphidium margaritaceum" /LENGTH=223 /DNA_ID=CAMNT_0049373795 /DNA_START=21 /DNA_END=692 /DNA_ORIENTATION=-
MVPPLLKMAMPMFMMLLVKNYFDTSDASTIFWFRIIFAMGQTLVIASLFFIWIAIPKSPNANQKLKLCKADLEEPSPFEQLWKKDANAGNSTEDKRTMKMTVGEYDKVVWQRKLKSTMISILVVPLLHLIFGLVVPLFMSVVLNMMGLLDDPLFRIYVRNHKPEHTKDLVRPFKFSNPTKNVQKMMDRWMPSGEQATDTDDASGAQKQSAKKSLKKRKKNKKM